MAETTYTTIQRRAPFLEAGQETPMVQTLIGQENLSENFATYHLGIIL